MRTTASYMFVGSCLALASDVTPFAGHAGAGARRLSMAAASSATAVTGGTKTPIKAIREGEVNHRSVETVGNLEEFHRTITRPKQVVAVWFQASWCRKCKYIGTRLKRLDEHLPAYLTNNLVVVSIDVNKVAEVPQRQKIKDLPTIQFFVEGEQVASYVATDRGEAFYANVEKHLREAMGEDVPEMN